MMKTMLWKKSHGKNDQGGKGLLFFIWNVIRSHPWLMVLNLVFFVMIVSMGIIRGMVFYMMWFMGLPIIIIVISASLAAGLWNICGTVSRYIKDSRGGSWKESLTLTLLQALVIIVALFIATKFNYADRIERRLRSPGRYIEYCVHDVDHGAMDSGRSYATLRVVGFLGIIFEKRLYTGSYREAFQADAQWVSGNELVVTHDWKEVHKDISYLGVVVKFKKKK